MLFTFQYRAIVSGEETFLKETFGSEFDLHCRLVPKSTARWKIVSMHLPIYSSAHDGWTGLNWWLNIFLEPLLVKYRVSVVLSGHNHFYERIKPQRGIYYFISGGGGADIRAVKQKEFSDRAASTHHFLLFEWEENKGWFQAVDICGHVFDSGILEPQGGS